MMKGGHRAGDRTRTGDVQLGKLAFYQLNYARRQREIGSMAPTLSTVSSMVTSLGYTRDALGG